MDEPDDGRVRAGILGTGGVARLHAEALAERADARLVAVSDVDPASAERFAAAHGATAVDGLDALLDAVDVLHICTPPSVHAPQAIAAVRAGVHVVLEKPPALSLAELDDILAAAESSGRKVAIVFQQRSGSAAAAVKRLLDSGSLGRPLLATVRTLWFRGADYYAAPWRGTWASEGGGTTLGHGIHQIDLLAHLLGDWTRVSGELWRLDRDIEVEDTSLATIEFAGGAIASVVTSAVAPREVSHVRIDTDRATVEVEHLYGHSRAHWRITPAPGIPPETVAEWQLPDDDVPSGHAALFDAVYPALVTDAPLPELVSAPARSMELVTAIHASARLGRAIRPDDLRDPGLRGGLESPVASRPR